MRPTELYGLVADSMMGKDCRRSPCIIAVLKFIAPYLHKHAPEKEGVTPSPKRHCLVDDAFDEGLIGVGNLAWAVECCKRDRASFEDFCKRSRREKQEVCHGCG